MSLVAHINLHRIVPFPPAIHAFDFQSSEIGAGTQKPATLVFPSAVYFCFLLNQRNSDTSLKLQRFCFL